MNKIPATPMGVIVGLALGFAGAFGGFWAFLLVVVTTIIGGVVGGIIDGRINVGNYVSGLSDLVLEPMTAPAPAGTLERGSTSLSDRVVDKIAARAALEVDHVHGVSSGLIAGVFHAQPTVGVTSAIDGQLAQLTLQVEVDYPTSLRTVTRQLRRHVSQRVRQLCDTTVTDVDIRVTALRPATRPVRRVLRPHLPHCRIARGQPPGRRRWLGTAAAARSAHRRCGRGRHRGVAAGRVHGLAGHPGADQSAAIPAGRGGDLLAAEPDPVE